MIEHINDGLVAGPIAVQRRVIDSAALLIMLVGGCTIDLSGIGGAGSPGYHLLGKKNRRTGNDDFSGSNVV